MKTLKLENILVLLLLTISQASYAYRFSPMNQTFVPKNNDNSKTFVVENPSDETIPLKVEATLREVALDGKETRPLTEDFNIFPEQLVLGPKEKKSIRVTWTGDSSPKKELSYRLVVSQLPVNMKPVKKTNEVQTNVSFLMQYVASLYVSPPNAQAKIRVTSFDVLDADSADLLLENIGTSHKRLNSMKLFIKPTNSKTDKPIELRGAILEKVVSENLLAGVSRKFRIDNIPVNLKDANWVAEITFE